MGVSPWIGAVTNCNEPGYELLPHTPEPLDLDRIDYFLLTNLKISLVGNTFDSNG